MPPSAIPEPIAALTRSYHWQRIDEGCSAAKVFMLEGGGTTLFVKTEPVEPLAELPGEYERLRWLTATAIPCPQPLDFHSDSARHWLVMTALPGSDLSGTDLPREQVVEIAADALRRLHSFDPAECPFDHRAARRIADARSRIEAGLVDAEDFDDDHRGRTPGSLFDELVRLAPKGEDLVVTHGDACLANLLANDDGFTGFIDTGRLGVADRHQDLALMVREIAGDHGEVFAAQFLQHYGIRADPERMHFYRLLDEFF